MVHFYCHNREENLQKRAFTRRKGNTSVEYALIGCLILVVGLAAWQMFGSNFNTAIAGIKGDMDAKRESAVAAWLSTKTKNGQLTGLSASEQAILQESLTSKLQTTGANGSTEVLAKQLELAAEQLLKDGKIDQSQYDILMKLSNEGHKIAKIQGLIGDAMKYANGDVAMFNNMSFTFEGQSYTATQLAKMIGFNGPAPADFATADILSSPTGGTTGSTVGNFLNLYNQALSSGALSDPMAKSTVDSASVQIASMGELTEDVIWNVQENGMPMDTASVTALTTASTSNMNSSKICKAGQFKDNGALCSP